MPPASPPQKPVATSDPSRAQLQILAELRDPPLSLTEVEAILETYGGDHQIAANHIIAWDTEVGRSLFQKPANIPTEAHTMPRRVTRGGLDPSKLLNTTTWINMHEVMHGLAHGHTTAADDSLYGTDRLVNGLVNGTDTKQEKNEPDEHRDGAQDEQRTALEAAIKAAKAKWDDAGIAASSTIAKSLAAEEEARARQTNNPPPRNITTESAPMAMYAGVRDVELLPMEIDEDGRKQLIREAIPYLMKKLEKLQVPAQTEPLEMELPILGMTALAYENAIAKVCFTEHSAVDVETSTEGVILTMERLEV